MPILKRLGFLMAFIMPFLLVWGHYQGGAWHYSAFIFAYGLIPIADRLIGRDQQNPTKEAIGALERTKYFEALLYCLVWLQFALLFSMAAVCFTVLGCLRHRL